MAKKLNFVIIALSLIVYISPFIEPTNNFWLFGFTSYLIPLFLTLNFLFVIYWILKVSPTVFYSIICLLIGSTFIKSSFSLNLTTTRNKDSFSVLSYNVACFNQYPNPSEKDGVIFKKYIKLIENAKTEIVTIQEYCNYRDYPKLNAKKFLKELGYKYQTTSSSQNPLFQFGQAIFSKFPILNTESISVPNNRDILIADIIKSKDTIRIINIHFNSIQLNFKHSDITNTEDLKVMARKIKNSISKRTNETDKLLTIIEDSPYPLILTGDFNATPYGNTYQRIKSKLNNSFEMAGHGFGSTYNGPIPFLRIDHQFSDSNIKVISSDVLNGDNLSDHLPLKVTYDLN